MLGRAPAAGQQGSAAAGTSGSSPSEKLGFGRRQNKEAASLQLKPVQPSEVSSCFEDVSFG